MYHCNLHTFIFHLTYDNSVFLILFKSEKPKVVAVISKKVLDYRKSGRDPYAKIIFDIHVRTKVVDNQ